MNISEIKRDYYLFNPRGYGRIFVFVDFGNVRHWAKSFWPKENKKYLQKEIDIEKIATVCEWIRPSRKFFYYGHWPENKKFSPEHENNNKFRQSIFRVDKAAKAGFTIRTKEIKMIDKFDENGRFLNRFPKCNFDVEIAMDMILKIEKYDSIFLWSGDSDFDGLLRYLKSKDKRTIAICAREFASEELRNSCDLFLPADPLKSHLEYARKTSTPDLRREA